MSSKQIVGCVIQFLGGVGGFFLACKFAIDIGLVPLLGEDLTICIGSFITMLAAAVWIIVDVIFYVFIHVFRSCKSSAPADDNK